MKRFSLLTVLLLGALCAGAEESKLILPFDGQTLNGWSGNTQYWRVEDGAITGEIPDGQSLNHNEFIYWSGETNDFDFTVDYRITGLPSANSGIQYRSKELPNHEAQGYQADLDDGAVWLGRVYEERKRGLIAERGSRVSIAPDGRRWKDVFAEPASFLPIIKKNDWNTYQVTVKASHSELRINGVLFSALDDHDAQAAEFTGKLAFQLHSGKGPSKIQFRNLRFIDYGKTAKPTYAETQTTPPPQVIGGIRPLGDNGQPLNLDFETGTLADWKPEGNAWEGQPVEGDAPAARNRGHSEHQGKFWIGGYERVGDKGTGTLTSASFTVTRPWGSFLVGGGRDPKLERVEIVEEHSGQVIFSASGEEKENMRRVAVKLEDFKGKRIFIRLVDQSTAGWGHLNFDDFLFHDEEPRAFERPPGESNKPNTADRSGHQKESPVLWHLQPNPAKPTAVANEDAQRVISTMMLTPGFQAELIAAEPDVRQPVAFAIDERGRLWVAEAYSYPKKRDEPGTDRILIFEDVDGDGTFKKRTVFYEGLNLVSGMEVGFGGVWVGAAPELLFIPKDEHDHAGKPQVLLDGWGYQDTHETLNSFCWGPDGWLYGNQGVFTKSFIGKPGASDSERLELHSGVWRYHPTQHKFEIFAHGGSNQWGLDFNSNGHFFMTHCRSFWGGGGTSQVIRNATFWNQANNGYGPYISATAPDFAPDVKNYLPAAARYDDGEGGAGKPGSTAIYGGHAHAGTLIYLGDNWPEIYRDELFTHNLFGHQMNHEHNVRQGSSYETFHAGYDLLFAPDPRYMAIDLQTGPDGAVYLIDWCDLQHCHNPDPDKWDRTNGRIYRVEWGATYRPVKVDLRAKSDVELAQLHTQRNDWYARAARGLLQERATKRAIDPQAIALLRQQAAGEETPQILRAVFSLYAIGALDAGELAKLAQHRSDVVRAWAVQLATEEPGQPQLSADLLLQLAKNDPSPLVRLAIASAMPTLAPAQVWSLGEALAAHGEDKDDRFLPKMVWLGLGPVVGQDYQRALALAEKTPLPSLADSIHWYMGHQPEGRDLLVNQLATEPDDVAARNVRLLAFALKDEARVPMPGSWPHEQARFSASSDTAVNAATNQLSALFGDQDVLAKMRGVLADDSQPEPQRKFAFDLLKRAGDAEATPIFARLLDTSFRTDVIPLLSHSTDPATSEALMQRFEKLNPEERSAALSTMTSRVPLALPLLHAVQSGKFDRKYLSALQVHQMRSLHDAQVDQLLDEGWGKLNESSEAMKATMARLKQAYTSAPIWAFDAKAGHETFNQICAVCHALDGVGGKLGPDLAGSWHNGLDYFLENIVDPNAVVGENYQLHIITKKDGTVVTGLLDQESDTAITLRTTSTPVIVAKADIQQHQKLAQSLMPPGLLESMPERKAIELLKFLTSKP